MPPVGTSRSPADNKPETLNLFATTGSLPRVHVRNASTMPQSGYNSEGGFIPRSPQHARSPKLVETGGVEEAMYNSKYIQTLNEEQGKGYHRQRGYFTDFARRNKILNDQYTEKRDPVASDHTRYFSKPVFFTTLKSKNLMSTTVASDHSQVLELARQNSKASTGGFGVNKLTTNRSLSSSKLKFGATAFSTFDSDKVVTGSAQETKKEVDEALSPQSCTTYSKFNKTLDKITLKESQVSGSSKLGSPKTRMISSFVRSEQAENPLEAYSKSYKPKNRGFQKSPDIHELGKYHTKEMADALALEYGSRTKVDPEVYIQHKQDVEYMRESAITIAQMDQEKKFLKAHQGSPQPYKRNSKLKAYEEPNPFNEIDKFDENIRGWVQSVPNFGKQRWTYDKAWEYKII